jgi:drug/metabolite transporter (DMT)-like permease
LLIGFCGIWFLLEPGSGAPVGWAVAVALLGTMLAAGAHLAIRALGASEHPLTLVFWFQLLIVGGTSLVLLADRGLPLPRAPVEHLLPLVLCGVSGALGQTLMTWAYKVDRAARVAPASWFGPLWGALGDYLVWHRAPTSSLITGGLLIAFSGLFLVFPASSHYLWAAPGRTRRWVRARFGR